MGDAVLHAYRRPLANTSTPTPVQPHEWNREHVFWGGAAGQALLYDVAKSDHVTWTTIPLLDAANVFTNTGGQEVYGSLKITHTNPILRFYESDGASGEKNLQLNYTGAILKIQSIDDAYTTPVDRIKLHGNGNADFLGTYGLAIGEVTGRRRVQGAASEISFLTDADGWAALKAASLFEGGRTAAAGYMTSPTYSAANFTASGSMTWTVESNDVTTYAYSRMGRRMVVDFYLSGTVIGGTASNSLYIAVPAGCTVAKSKINPVLIVQNGTAAIGYAEVIASGTTIAIRRSNASNFTITSNVTVAGEIEFETTT